jgi:hypothetical protein
MIEGWQALKFFSEAAQYGASFGAGKRANGPYGWMAHFVHANAV